MTTAGARLAFIRVRAPLSMAEVEEMIGAVRRHSLAAQKGLYCTDLRGSGAFAPEIIDSIIGMMTKYNPAVVRNAIFYSANSSMGLQMLRAFKAAHSGERRRAFTDGAQLVAWMAELLDDEEQARLREFIAEPE